jgi:hypothetical protein
VQLSPDASATLTEALVEPWAVPIVRAYVGTGGTATEDVARFFAPTMG